MQKFSIYCILFYLFVQVYSVYYRVYTFRMTGCYYYPLGFPLLNACIRRICVWTLTILYYRMLKQFIIVPLWREGIMFRIRVDWKKMKKNTLFQLFPQKGLVYRCVSLRKRSESSIRALYELGSIGGRLHSLRARLTCRAHSSNTWSNASSQKVSRIV